MTTDALLRLSQGQADLLGRFFAGLGADHPAAREADIVIDLCLQAGRVPHSVWAALSERLETTGVEGGDLRDICNRLVAVAAGYLDVMRAAAQLAGRASPGRLEELNDAAAELERLRATAAEAQAWAARPPPPVDPAQLAAGAAAIARGEYEDTEAIIARLRAGGTGSPVGRGVWG